MAVVFRPVGAAAVQYRGFADRLGAQVAVAKSGGSTRILDGFLFRAVRANENVIVYVVDPEAVWAFLHKGTFVETGLLFAVRAFTRDTLRPGAPLNIATPVGTTEALLQYQPGGGFVGTIDTGALQLATNRPSTPAVTHATVSLSTLASATNAVSATFATGRFQLLTDVFGAQAQQKWYAPGADTSEFVGIYPRLYDWIFPEAGLAAITEDANARLFPRQHERYDYRMPVFAPQNTGEGLASPTSTSVWYSDPLVGGAYVSQPNGTDIAPPNNDPAWLGISGTFVARFRRPQVPGGNFYPLGLVRTTRRLLTDNPEPELRPALVIPDGLITKRAVHGVSSSGLCYALTEADELLPPDGGGSRGDVHLFSHVFCYQDDVLWHALQRQTLTAAGGIIASTIYKGTDQFTFTIGHRVSMYGVNGVYGTRRPTTTAAASADVDFIHIGVDDVIRVTGLRGAGWYAFTDYVGIVAAIENGAIWGQSSVPATYIGNGRVAVLARDYIVPDAAVTVTWSVVIIDQMTGDFVEARGVVGDASAFTYTAHLVVVTPEIYDAESGVTTPAVLACNLSGTTRLSTDGGLTWEIAFSGFLGYPLYLGNQLRNISYGREL